MNSFKTWHTETRESSNFIQAGGIILARVGVALIDVHLTARPCVALQTLTVERALGVDAFPSVLTRIAVCHCTFIHILSAVCSLMALRTGADVVSIHRVGVTKSTFLARIANTGIIQVAQKTCLSLWTDAGEGSHPVDAGGAIGTGGSEAVIDVLAAVVPAPAVDADAGVAPVVVGAGAPVLAGIGLELAFIHILGAKLACPLGRAAAVVGVHPVHANTPVQALVVGAVVHVVSADAPLETGQAVALEGEVTGLVAGAPVHAGGRGAGHVGALAAVARVAQPALAAVGAGQVDTGATVLAQPWCGTFVHVCLAPLASVARRAGAGELISRHSACTSIGTRLRCAGINPLAFLSCETWDTDALVRILAMGVTSASVKAGLGHVAEVRF